VLGIKPPSRVHLGMRAGTRRRAWTSNGASASYNHLQHGRFLVSITLIVDIASSPPLLRANQRPVTAIITAATSLSPSMLLLLGVRELPSALVVK